MPRFKLLPKKGTYIGVIDRGHDGLEGAIRDVENLGGKALLLPLDIVYADASSLCRNAGNANWGQLTYGNVAMTRVFSPVKERQPDEYKRVTEVCYLGYVAILAPLKRMLKPRTDFYVAWETFPDLLAIALMPRIITPFGKAVETLCNFSKLEFNQFAQLAQR